jgi:hypothetical protein
VSDPAHSRQRFAELGFQPDGERLRVGDASLELERGVPFAGARSLLNHLGLRVESAGEQLAEARRRGLEIADVVDAENTYAVFVWGPDRIKLEYVEHKASFSLVLCRTWWSRGPGWRASAWPPARVSSEHR